MDIMVEEFMRIRSLETKHKRIELGKDIFLLSFYLGGMNLADLVQVDFSGVTVGVSIGSDKMVSVGKLL